MTEVVTLSPVSAVLWTGPQRASLVRMCAAIVRDAVAAEDLARETLLEAWRHRHRLTDPSGADAWLNAIARNACRRWLRARVRVPAPTDDLDGDLGVASEAADLDSVLEREELVELLDRALALLPAGTREALVEHYVEERSHAEIAERIGTSADAVSMRVSRGRTRLRYLLETRVRRRRGCPGMGAPKGRRMAKHSAALRRLWPVEHLDVSRRDRGRLPLSVLHAVRPHDPLPLDTPVFSSLIAGLRRPSAIEARTAAWSVSYWTASLDSATVACVRCSRPLVQLAYTREDRDRWSGRRGWYADCSACGEQVSGSVAGLALAQPQILAARRAEPRLRSLPVRDVVRDGAPAKIVAFAGPDGIELASAIFLRDSLRLVHVSTTAADGG